MSKKYSINQPNQKEDKEINPIVISSLPQIMRFRNLTNQTQPNNLIALMQRIDELQKKVNQLEMRIQSKRRRIRRKSCEVQKRHTCDFCKRRYGSLVSLNLHYRIKHKTEKQDKQEERDPQLSQQVQSFNK